MLTQAIAKIKSELDQKKDDSYVQVVGGFLLQHLESRPQDAEKIMTAGKTVAGSLEAMRKEAQKKKSGSCAVLTDQEGFAIVLKYFGVTTVPTGATAPVAVPEDDFDVKLEDLL